MSALYCLVISSRHQRQQRFVRGLSPGTNCLLQGVCQGGGRRARQVPSVGSKPKLALTHARQTLSVKGTETSLRFWIILSETHCKKGQSTLGVLFFFEARCLKLKFGLAGEPKLWATDGKTSTGSLEATQKKTCQGCWRRHLVDQDFDHFCPHANFSPVFFPFSMSQQRWDKVQGSSLFEDL